MHVFHQGLKGVRPAPDLAACCVSNGHTDNTQAMAKPYNGPLSTPEAFGLGIEKVGVSSGESHFPARGDRTD